MCGKMESRRSARRHDQATCIVTDPKQGWRKIVRFFAIGAEALTESATNRGAFGGLNRLIQLINRRLFVDEGCRAVSSTRADYSTPSQIAQR
jgi:hypothetical protein